MDSQVWEILLSYNLQQIAASLSLIKHFFNNLSTRLSIYRSRLLYILTCLSHRFTARIYKKKTLKFWACPFTLCTLSWVGWPQLMLIIQECFKSRLSKNIPPLPPATHTHRVSELQNFLSGLIILSCPFLSIPSFLIKCVSRETVFLIDVTCHVVHNRKPGCSGPFLFSSVIRVNLYPS